MTKSDIAYIVAAFCVAMMLASSVWFGFAAITSAIIGIILNLAEETEYDKTHP